MSCETENDLNSREVIVQAAEQLMTGVGYDKASISQICKTSGLPVGSIYHHFGSKAGLLTCVISPSSCTSCPTSDS